MDFATQQRSPSKHIAGITFVIVFHIILVWALIHGLASKVIDVIKPPLEAKIVEEVKPPPPPEIKLPPPPKLAAPPPPYIPPPEVQIQTPPVNTVATTTAPPPPTAFIPQAQPAPAAPAQPGPKGVQFACSNAKAVGASIEYPVKAARAGIDKGSVTVVFQVSGSGEVSNVSIQSSTNRLFNDAALAAVRALKCAGTGETQIVAWPMDFKTE
jgi:protein TonB